MKDKTKLILSIIVVVLLFIAFGFSMGYQQGYEKGKVEMKKFYNITECCECVGQKSNIDRYVNVSIEQKTRILK